MNPFRSQSTSDQLADHLRKEILSGRLHGAMPGIQQIVKSLGVNSVAVSKAVQQQRAKTLENENHVRDIMQDVKEEKVALLKQLQNLDRERLDLTKAHKQTKTAYAESKAALEADVATYQTLLSTPDPDKAADHDDQVALLFARIEENRNRLVQQRELQKALKDQIKANHDHALDLRAEMDAQKLLLKEDAGLRKAIQDEERSKPEKEIQGRREELIAGKVEEEKERIETRVHQEMRSIEKSYQRKLTVVHNHQVAVDTKASKLELRGMNAYPSVLIVTAAR